MPIRKKMKNRGADSAKVSKTGNKLRATGRHLIEIQSTKSFKDSKKNDCVALEFKVLDTDCADGEFNQDKMYSHVFNLDKTLGGDDGYVDVHSMQQFLEAVAKTDDEDVLDELAEAFEADPAALKGEQVVAETQVRTSENDRIYTKYTFEPVE